MAWERPDSICGAVLRLPGDSAILADLRKVLSQAAPDLCTALVIRAHTRLRMHWARFEKWVKRKPPPRLHYGPAALTHLVGLHRLQSEVMPQTVYYPFSPWSLDEMRVLVDGEKVAEYIVPETRGVHLWRSLYKRVNGLGLPPQQSLAWTGRSRVRSRGLPRLNGPDRSNRMISGRGRGCRHGDGAQPWRRAPAYCTAQVSPLPLASERAPPGGTISPMT